MKRWTLNVLYTILGGGFTSALTAALDPAKYRFPQDLFSGKLWRFFLAGAILTLGGILTRKRPKR